jgi:peptidoglycan biosynthesis protein MviN/MurJ (putative lipid II flippase)
MDFFASFGSVLAAVAAVVSIFCGIKGWILTAEEDRQKVIQHWKRWLSLTSILVAIVGSAAVGLASAWQVFEFGFSDAPITRRAVLMLLINMFNCWAYLGFAVAVPMMVKAIRKRDEMYRYYSQT